MSTLLAEYIIEYEAYRTMLSLEKDKIKVNLISELMYYISRRIKSIQDDEEINKINAEIFVPIQSFNKN